MKHPWSRIVRDESDDDFIIGHPSAHGVPHDGFIVVAVLASSALDDREVVLLKTSLRQGTVIPVEHQRTPCRWKGC